MSAKNEQTLVAIIKEREEESWKIKEINQDSEQSHIEWLLS